MQAERQSVEHSVIELRAALPRLIADLRNAPADAEARAELRGKLASLRDDAELIGDAELAAQADAVLREIDAGAADAAVAASVDADRRGGRRRPRRRSPRKRSACSPPMQARSMPSCSTST